MYAPSDTRHGASTYSNNSNGGQPPSYNQAIEMNNIVSAPLLEETFSSSIFGTSKSIQFEYNCQDASGYSFFIRDTAGSIQAKGDVYNLDTSVENINGIQMLKVYKIESIESIDGNIVHEFDIIHKGGTIGTVKVAEKTYVQPCLQIISRSANPQTIVRSFKVGEFAIFRDNSSVTPLCNIQMSVGEENDFSGKIIFHPETGITTEEQLLCTAAGIAFKVAMKQVRKKEDAATYVVSGGGTGGGWLGYVGGCLCIGVIILVFVFLFLGVEKWGCESKKAKGYAGYVNKQC